MANTDVSLGASAAAVMDALCGGRAGLDRARLLAGRLAEVSPPLVAGLRSERAFVNRAVARAAEAGILQFVQAGCGYPGVRMLHEVAGRGRHGVRAVYADEDPAAVGVFDVLTIGMGGVACVVRGVKDPDAVLGMERVRAVIDPSRPMCLVLGGTLAQLVDDRDPPAVMSRWRSRLASGSWLVMCHPTAGEPGRDAAAAHEAAKLFHAFTGTPLVLRTPEEIARLFAGLDVHPPGLVAVDAWRPALLRGHPVPMLGAIASVPGESRKDVR